jgi:hypothetical protein
MLNKLFEILAGMAFYAYHGGTVIHEAQTILNSGVESHVAVKSVDIFFIISVNTCTGLSVEFYIMTALRPTVNFCPLSWSFWRVMRVLPHICESHFMKSLK